MNRQVSGILFDLGGVLVALDGVPSLARLLQIEASHEEIHKLWVACPSVVLHETGRIPAQEFAERVIIDLHLPASQDAFLLEFADWLEAPYPGAFDLVERIPRTYRVAALSNLSAFHWDRIKAMGLPKRFEAMYVSHEIGYLKPSRGLPSCIGRDGVAPRQGALLGRRCGQRQGSHNAGYECSRRQKF
jgi:FMN phosphatase YigB (HAD superfamily)